MQRDRRGRWRAGAPWNRSITGAVHHHGVPIFVPSHRPPGPSVANYPLVTYVTDGIESAMAQAKAAAGDRNVLVHGAYTAQRALEAGVLDELQIHQIPVLFGRGLRTVRRLAVARRAGDRPGDRHTGGHPHPLPCPSLTRAARHPLTPIHASHEQRSRLLLPRTVEPERVSAENGSAQSCRTRVVGSDARPRDGGRPVPDRKCSRLRSQQPDPSAQNAGVASHPGRPSPTPDSALGSFTLWNTGRGT